MIRPDVAVIGGGPAGLCAASAAAALGARVLLIDNGPRLGGQLIKQTHRFFGSRDHFAGRRGFEIAEGLREEARSRKNLEILSPAAVTGIYEDGVLTAVKGRSFLLVKPQKVVVATGASEKMIPFVNNDLPGVYGAGAVQTLMNLYGVLPGSRVLMVGAGNIGLIVAYQLLQAGIEVAALVEAEGQIGGYEVHASKVQRSGVSIYTRHSLRGVYGREGVEKAVIVAQDSNRQWIHGTEKELAVDTVCLAVGLAPLADLLWMAGCRLKYVRELGGFVPLRDHRLQTTSKNIYVAGDAGGIEEATSAMIAGRIAGLNAALSLGFSASGFRRDLEDLYRDLEAFRDNPAGKKVRDGLRQVLISNQEESRA